MMKSLAFFKGKRLLVTGSSGYLAWNLFRMLGQVDCELNRVSRHGISSIEEWQTILPDVDFVVHFAAQTSVAKANANPKEDWEYNVKPMLALLEAVRTLSKKPFILFSGSVTQMGPPTHLPADEGCPDCPATIYCIHKLMAEQYLEFYCRQGWARGTTLRLANVYGPGPKSGNSDRGILNQMIRRGLQGEDITLFGRGDQRRDYVFVEDVVSAFLSAAERSAQTNGRHFIVSTGIGYSLSDAFHLVAEKIGAKTGIPIHVRQIAAGQLEQAVDNRDFVGNSALFYETTGWKHRYLLPEGIDQTISYLSESQTIA